MVNEGDHDIRVADSNLIQALATLYRQLADKPDMLQQWGVTREDILERAEILESALSPPSRSPICWVVSSDIYRVSAYATAGIRCR